MPSSYRLFLSPSTSVLLLLLLTPLSLAATPFQSPPSALRVLTFPVPLSRGVDDVAPAVTNATQTALVQAEAILNNYSTLLRIIAIPTGLLVAFFGYFLLSPVLFLAAFTCGGTASFVAVRAALGDDTPAAAWLAIAAMLLGGALLAFLALHALTVGMFAVGAALGVVLAAALKASVIAAAFPADPQLAFYVAAGVCGLLFGLLAVWMQKPMLILSTAYAGSCAAVFGVGHFAGHFPTTEDLERFEEGQLGGWVLLYVLLTLAVGTAGMACQFWLARNKPMPEHAPRDRRRRRRRVRRDDAYENWSDTDEEWGGEHVPLPGARRKQEAYASRVDIQTPIQGGREVVKVEVGERIGGVQRSWESEEWRRWEVSEGKGAEVGVGGRGVEGVEAKAVEQGQDVLLPQMGEELRVVDDKYQARDALSGEKFGSAVRFDKGDEGEGGEGGGGGAREWTAVRDFVGLDEDYGEKLELGYISNDKTVRQCAPQNVIAAHGAECLNAGDAICGDAHSTLVDVPLETDREASTVR